MNTRAIPNRKYTLHQSPVQITHAEAIPHIAHPSRENDITSVLLVTTVLVLVRLALQLQLRLHNTVNSK
jgi:hypothetical protein